MQKFKLTAWNIEWADKLIDELASGDPSKKSKAERRAAAIAAELDAIDADILEIGEGPKGEARAQAFFDLVAPGYDLVLRGDDDAYETLGRQWIWFLIKKGTEISGTLLHVDRWREVVREASLDQHSEKWNVGMPTFLEAGGTLVFSPEVSHRHYRQPQALQATVDGHAFEIIGAHLKSKYINQSTPPGIGQPGSFIQNPKFVAAVIEARVKLTSEATDMRYYIDGRFKANVEAPIIVAGDFNDGPGKEIIEEQFLLHDLIGNLQGEVFFARRYLNHALFDFDDEERWTVQFKDELDPRRPREILLDHIMFTQSFVGEPREGAFPFEAPPHGGLVEHDAHHAANAGLPKSAGTSDHRPVSMVFIRRPVG